MVAVPAPSRGSLPGWLRPERIGALAARLARPARAPLANLAASPLHAAGLACIDAGVFTASLTAGLIITGLSLMWLEHVIADEG